MSFYHRDETVPCSPVPGQVGKVFIGALSESGSFSDPERAPLLAGIKYSSEQAAVTGVPEQSSVGVEVKEAPGRRCHWGCVIVCLALCALQCGILHHKSFLSSNGKTLLTVSH